MKCPKRGYRDEIAAKLALASTWRKDSPTRAKLERRAYYHAVCRRWHLTSMEGADATV